MRLVRDTVYIGQQSRRSKLLALAGFLLFIAVFGIMAFTGNVLFAYAAMIPAYLLFIMGMQQLGKWSNSPRRPRADLTLDNQLKHLPDGKYTMIHYARVGKRVVEHVLVHPGGLLVLVVRDVAGKVSLKGRRFTRSSGILSRLIGASGPPLGMPDIELKESIAAIESQLKEEQLELDVDGVVVFTAFDHQLDEDDPELDVISVRELGDYVRFLPADAGLRPQERDRVIAILSGGKAVESAPVQRTRRPVVVKRRAATKS